MHEHAQLELALRQAQAAQQPTVAAEILRKLGMLAAEQRNYASARAYFEQGLGIQRTLGDRLGEATALNDLGNVASDQGSYVDADTYHTQCLAIRRDIGDRFGQSVTLLNIGATAYALGAYPRAHAHFAQSLQMSAEIGSQAGMCLAEYNLGLVAWCEGNIDQASTRFLASLEAADATVPAYYRTFALIGLAETQRERGKLAAARHAAESAIALRNTQGNPALHMEAIITLALIEQRDGQYERTRMLIEQVVAFLESGGSFAGTEFRIGNLLRCAQILAALHDSRAAALLQVAYQHLQREAATLESDSARVQFVENIPWHRALVAAYEPETGACNQMQPSVG